MANQTITLKGQSLNSFGPSPSTKWQSFKWTAAGVGPGNGTWGMKSAACMGTSPIQKGLFRTLTHTSMSVGMSCPAASALFKNLNKVWSKVQTISVAYANTDKEQSDGKGYRYIYPDRTTNAENQFKPIYTSITVSAGTYTSAAVSVTPWT